MITTIILFTLALLAGYIGGLIHGAYLTRIRRNYRHARQGNETACHFVTENPFNPGITRRGYTGHEDKTGIERAKANPEDFK